MKKKRMKEALVEACDLLDWFVQKFDWNRPGGLMDSTTALKQSIELLKKMKKKDIWVEPNHKVGGSLPGMNGVLQPVIPESHIASEQVAT